jgi:hypothetical protein
MKSAAIKARTRRLTIASDRPFLACAGIRGGLNSCAIDGNCGVSRKTLMPGIVIGSAPADAKTSAQIDPARVTAVTKAADSFADLAKGSDHSGFAPNQRDPQVRALLDTLCDTSWLSAEPPARLADCPKFTAIFRALGRVASIYTFAGTGASYGQVYGKGLYGKEVGGIREIDPAILRQMGRNFVTFAPELGRLLDARLIAANAMMKAVLNEKWINPQLFEQPKLSEAVEMTRQEIIRYLAQFPQILRLPGHTDEWCLDRLAAYAEIVPTGVAFVLPSNSRPIRDALNDAADLINVPEVQSMLRAVSSQFVLH